MSTWRFFAECLCFAECFFLVCRVFFFSARQRVCLPSAIILPSIFFAALDKELVCRVADRMHSANIYALSKYAISGSVLQTLADGFEHPQLPSPYHPSPASLKLKHDLIWQFLAAGLSPRPPHHRHAGHADHRLRPPVGASAADHPSPHVRSCMY